MCLAGEIMKCFKIDDPGLPYTTALRLIAKYSNFSFYPAR